MIQRYRKVTHVYIDQFLEHENTWPIGVRVSTVGRTYQFCYDIPYHSSDRGKWYAGKQVKMLEIPLYSGDYIEYDKIGQRYFPTRNVYRTLGGMEIDV